MNKLAIHGGTPVRSSKIYYGHQYIDESDISAVVNVLKSDFLTCGPKINELEDKLCEITRAKYALAVSNGTAALHLSCLAAGLGEGDEVITTPLTFAASANCALYCGAVPVFADVDLSSYLISPEDIRKKITPNTKAIVAVDFTGVSVALDEIREICNEYNLILIEDAAHSIGTKYGNCYIGNIADMTTFSFHPVKTITGGEGGAILTNSKELYDKLLLLRSHGITRNIELLERKEQEDWYYEQLCLGYNYRMTDMQAALIVSQLEKLDKFKERRKQIVDMYNEAFSQLDGIIIQKEEPKSDTARHLYIIQLELEKFMVGRKEIFDALKAENVCCNVHYIPTYYFPFYQKLGYKKGICPNAEKIYEGIISIPLFYSMTNEDVESVIEAVKKVTDYYRR